MKTVIIGANGQLGSDLSVAYANASHEITALTHDLIEIANFESVQSILNNIKPDYVINTAAMHNVELCESDPAKSFAVNAIGARNLAIICKNLDAYLIHFSTDYVFDGAKKSPYIEDDAPHPLNVYAVTKLAGEHFIQTEYPESAVIRISGVYGTNLCRAKSGMNFIRLMLKLAKERDEVRVVDNEILSPTFTQDIAVQCLEITRLHLPGLFHATSQGACSWYEFAGRIFDRINARHKLKKANLNEFPAKVRRPTYSVLDNAALRKNGIDVMPTWENALDRYLNLILE